MIKYTEEKTFTQDQVQELFKSVGWISAEYPQRLHKALAILERHSLVDMWNLERHSQNR